MKQNAKYKCWMEERKICGHRAVILQDGKLQIGLLPDWGLTAYELIDLQSGVDFLYHERLGMERIRETRSLTPTLQDEFWDMFLGGWFELFPNAGKACFYQGVRYAHHGEVLQLPWKMKILEHSEAKLRLKFEVNTLKTPFHLERVMEMRAGAGCVFLEERVKNTCRLPQRYLWGHHVTIGGTFLNEHCRISMPACRISDHCEEQRSVSSIQAGGIGVLKEMPGADGTKMDASRIASRTAHQNDALFADKMQEHWTAITDVEKKMGIGICWDGTAFPTEWIWKESGGSVGFPFYGEAYAVSLEPQVSTTPILTDACEDGTAGSIDGYGEKTSWMTICTYRDIEEVAGISREGIVLPEQQEGGRSL